MGIVKSSLPVHSYKQISTEVHEGHWLEINLNLIKAKTNYKDLFKLYVHFSKTKFLVIC